MQGEVGMKTESGEWQNGRKARGNKTQENRMTKEKSGEGLGLERLNEEITNQEARLLYVMLQTTSHQGCKHYF